MKVYVHTVDYEMAHGKRPRGEGGWAFFFDRHAPVEDAWFFSGTYAAAKKAAQAEAAKRGKSTVYVGS